MANGQPLSQMPAHIATPGSDPPLIEQLFEQYEGAVFGLCRQITRNETEAEDLTHDVFLQALRALPTLRDVAHAKPWLMQIAHRRCLDYLRHRNRFRWLSLGLGQTERDTIGIPDLPQSEESNRETVLDVRATLQQLTPQDRLLLVLRDSLEMTYDEIAHVTGHPAASARTEVYRARHRFVQLYQGTAPASSHRKEEE